MREVYVEADALVSSATIADPSHQIDIPPFGLTADVVGLADICASHDGPDSGNVVLYIEPVTDIVPFSLYGQALPFEHVHNHERDQLFRKLERAIVVRAIGKSDRNTVGVEVCTDEVIGGSF
jgi:hypothetical protein